MTPNVIQQNLSLNDRFCHSLVPYICHTLMDPSTISWSSRLLSLFPNIISPGLGFDFSLGDKSKATDLSFYLNAGDSLDILAGRHKDRTLPDQITQIPAWKRLAKFGDSWSDLWLDSIESLWLEFGKSLCLKDSLVPRFFVKINASQCQEKTVKYMITQHYTPILELITGKKWSHFFDDYLFCFWKDWPVEASIFQLGTHAEALSHEIRICIRGIALQQMKSFLSSRGWSKIGEVDYVIEKFGPLVNRIDLALDVNIYGINRVGLECHVDNGLKDFDNWLPLLNTLLSNGLLTKGKMSALQVFPGSTNDLRENKSFQSNRVPDFVILGCQRWLHHIKFAIKENSPVLAKAYIGANQWGIPRKSWLTLIDAQIKARKESGWTFSKSQRK